MAIVCVTIPHFALAVAIEGTPHSAQEPVLVADGLVRARVVDASPAALSLGARIGMTVLQAQASVREAATVLTDPAGCRERWEAILTALDAVSPLIEDGGEGCASCEMRGIEGEPARWLRGIRDALAGFAGMRFAVGIGPNRFVARVAATRERICPPGEEAKFVAAMPLRVLALDPETEDRLHLLGIRTLGELAALPHGPFVRRFGPEAARWHALARGIDDTPLIPRPHHARIARTLYGEGSATSEEALLFALRGLVARVADDLAHLGMRAAEMALTLECEDGEIHAIPVRLAHPTARETMLFDLIRARLEGVRLQAPVEGLRLGVERMETGGVPLALFAGNDPDAEAVELALARLDAAFGDGAALRARITEGHRPESRVAYERFAAEVLQTKMWRALSPQSVSEAASMQLRTLEPREIDVVVRGGVPRFVGTPAQSVLDVAGPWRVDEGWWSTVPLTRDDYDVMLEDGTLYRIARRGDRWFVCGLYD